MIILKILNYPKEIIRRTDKDFCSRMFILELFVITNGHKSNVLYDGVS